MPDPHIQHLESLALEADRSYNAAHEAANEAYRAYCDAYPHSRVAAWKAWAQAEEVRDKLSVQRSVAHREVSKARRAAALSECATEIGPLSDERRKQLREEATHHRCSVAGCRVCAGYETTIRLLDYYERSPLVKQSAFAEPVWLSTKHGLYPPPEPTDAFDLGLKEKWK